MWTVAPGGTTTATVCAATDMDTTIELPAEDIEFLDSLIAKQEFTSRTDAVHKALELLQKEIAENGSAFLK